MIPTWKAQSFSPISMLTPGVSRCVSPSTGGHLQGEETFLLTTEALPYAIAADFGYEMTPVEQNIIYGVAGNDIHLYDLSRPGPKPANRFIWEQHELCTLRGRHLLKFCGFKFLNKLRGKLSAKK